MPNLLLLLRLLGKIEGMNLHIISNESVWNLLAWAKCRCWLMTWRLDKAASFDLRTYIPTGAAFMVSVNMSLASKKNSAMAVTTIVEGNVLNLRKQLHNNKQPTTFFEHFKTKPIVNAKPKLEKTVLFPNINKTAPRSRWVKVELRDFFFQIQQK